MMSRLTPRCPGEMSYSQAEMYSRGRPKQLRCPVNRVSSYRLHDYAGECIGGGAGVCAG